MKNLKISFAVAALPMYVISLKNGRKTGAEPSFTIGNKCKKLNLIVNRGSGVRKSRKSGGIGQDFLKKLRKN